MSFVAAAYRIEVGLGGAALVQADAPAGYWRLGDAVGSSTAADSSGHGYTGTVHGGVTFGQTTPQPDGDTAALFDSTSGYVSTAAPISTTPTFAAWVTPTGSGFFLRILSTGASFPFELATSGGTLQFFLNFVGFSPGWTDTGVALTAGVWTHLAMTWDGTTLRIYKNGLQIYSNATWSGRVLQAGTVFLGGVTGGGSYWPGTLDDCALFDVPLTAAQMWQVYVAGIWTSLGLDVCKAPGPHWRRGNSANGPLDHVAGTGTLEFAVRNDARNTGSTEGWYSPNHASCRTGWGYGIPVRLVSTYQSLALGDSAPVDRVLWRGKITTLLPDAGKYGPRQVHVTAQDCIGDLAQNDAIQIAPQLNQSEDALIQAVISAMPAAAQPPAVSLDTGVDTYPYAFDTIGGGVKALSAITDVAVSAYGWVYCLANGTLRYESRHTRALKTSSFTFTELTHDDVVVPSALDNVYNRVRVTIHPRTIDPAATTVLCAATGSVLVGPGQTVTVWDTYRDQTNTLKLIGGTGFVTPIVATTDYLGNTASDGSGADVTASIGVVTTTFAASAKFDITNSGTVDAYVTRRQVRGKGIYDNAPVTFESYIPMSYGDRPLDIDLPYQTDVAIAQAFAAYIATLFSALTNQADAVSLNPQRSDALMTQALVRDVGDLITESETITGMNGALLQILGVEGAIEPGQILKMRYVVGWAGTGNVFIFDDAVHGVFDSALSPLGYA